MPRTPPLGPPPVLICRLQDDMNQLLRSYGIRTGRVAWKTNAAGEYVVAAIVPAGETVMSRPSR